MNRPYNAYLTKGRFVVVERLRGGKLEVLDPSHAGHWSWTPEELLARSEGRALSIRASKGMQRPASR